MNSGIELKNVTMRFKETTALDEVSLCMGENTIYGLLGRNGAGKSTLLGCVTNRLFPQQGSVAIDGEPVRENDRVLGRVYFMGEKNFCPEGTTARQLFDWTSAFYPGFDRAYARELAREFGLDVRKKLKGLSTGYLTIAKLVCALSTRVPYLLLDEPVLGLDANHREFFYKKLLENYAEYPRTIVISTHLIEEAADIIEQVVILKQGRLLLTGPTEKIRRMGVQVSGRADEVERWSRGRDVICEETLGGLKRVCVLGQAERLPDGLEAHPLDLQELFVRLTNA